MAERLVRDLATYHSERVLLLWGGSMAPLARRQHGCRSPKVVKLSWRTVCSACTGGVVRFLES